MDTGPTDAGDDLERLMSELRAKGWSPGKLEALRDRWEDICHDPMRRGRGGKGIPENERPEPQRIASVEWSRDGLQARPAIRSSMPPCANCVPKATCISARRL